MSGRIEVSDTKAIARVLDKMGVEYSIASDTAADIFADVQATELIERAAKENCTVFSMKERDESLESFYMNLIGGGAMIKLIRANFSRLLKDKVFLIALTIMAAQQVHSGPQARHTNDRTAYMLCR